MLVKLRCLMCVMAWVGGRNLALDGIFRTPAYTSSDSAKTFVHCGSAARHHQHSTRKMLAYNPAAGINS